MADKLTIYRGALRLIGHGAGLSSLTEVSQARLELDNAWDSSVSLLLTKGLWNFAMRSVELSKDDDLTPQFGHTYAFSKPDDWVRTAAVSDTGNFYDGEFEEYDDEGDYWFASVNPLYVKYVSDDASYGLNIAAWRQRFAKALEAHLAFETAMALGKDRAVRNDMFNLYKQALSDAKSLDAVDERVRTRPRGRLVKARLASGSRKDG